MKVIIKKIHGHVPALIISGTITGLFAIIMLISFTLTLSISHRGSIGGYGPMGLGSLAMLAMLGLYGLIIYGMVRLIVWALNKFSPKLGGIKIDMEMDESTNSMSDADEELEN